jgi:hypothetical protein
MLFNNMPGRGPGLMSPVPETVPKIGANISIMNCDYNLAPNELGPIIILRVSGTAQLLAIW